MALPAFAGGGDDEEDKDNESANGGSTRNGQIVFRRYLDPDQTKGVLFTMNPDGSHVSQITHPPTGWHDDVPVREVRMLPNDRITPLFQATAWATEAAITNALLAAETMTGADNLRVFAMPVDRMLAIMRKYGRLP